MIYTTEQKKELDAILKAFENYIDGQNYFDIVYSKKIGYVWIVADEPGAAGAEQLDTPEAMLDNRFFDYHRNDPDRRLHVRQVYDCVNIPEVPLAPIDPVCYEVNGLRVTDYYSSPGEYVAKRLDVDGPGSFSFDRFMCIVCVKGEGKIDGIPIRMPETVLIPADHGPVRLDGAMQLYMISYIDEQ